MTVNAAAEVANRLRVIRGRAATTAPLAAANACGKAGETTVKLVLTARSHMPGTPTPSPKGKPPAKISGDLARSVQRVPAMITGPAAATTIWGPTLIYGTVQEFGMTIHVRRARVLANRNTGQVFGPQVTLPPRPFMRPTTVTLIESGTFGRVAAEAFLAALED